MCKLPLYNMYVYIDPFFCSLLCSDTLNGKCIIHVDKNVAVNILTHIRFYKGPDSCSHEGATVFYPGGEFDGRCYAVKLKHLRSTLANFRQVYHNALPWQNNRAVFSVYTDHRVLDFCHAFKITSFEGNICVFEKRTDAEIVEALKKWAAIRKKYKLV